MVATADEGAIEHAVRDGFRSQVEAFCATFRDELEVAEHIDMFHLTRADWDAADVALVAIAYVAFACRFWSGKHAEAGEAIGKAVDREVRRALAAVGASRQHNGDALVSRIDEIYNGLVAIHARADADGLLSRPRDEIAHVCANLLKPESRHKAHNIALMPFLQIYMPERFAEILRHLDFQARRTRPVRATA
jgi:hypothetical protein